MAKYKDDLEKINDLNRRLIQFRKERVDDAQAILEDALIDLSE